MHPPSPPISPPASPSVPTIPSPPCSLTASLQTSLTQLLTQHLCIICRQILQSPVQLPCNHIFCSRCIREALLQHSHCPQPFCKHTTTTTSLSPLRDYDHALHTLRTIAASSPPSKPPLNSIQDHLTPLCHKSPGAKALLTDKLKSLGLPVTGSLQTLAERYRRLCVCWNANLDAAVPKPVTEVVKTVLKEENAVKNAQQRMQIVTSPFFALKGKEVPKEKDEDEGKGIVKQGDGFEQMIKNIAARKTAERERKQKLQVEQNTREERLDLLSSLMLRKGMNEKGACRIGNHLLVNGVCGMDIRPSSSDQVAMNANMGEYNIQPPKRHKASSGLIRTSGNSSQMHFSYQQNQEQINNGGNVHVKSNRSSSLGYQGERNLPAGGVKRRWTSGSGNKNDKEDKNFASNPWVRTGAELGTCAKFVSQEDDRHPSMFAQGMHQPNAGAVHDFGSQSQRGVMIQQGDPLGVSPSHPTQSGLVSYTSPVRSAFGPEQTGRVHNSSVDTSPTLSAELQQQIEKKRQRAIQLKKQFQERQRLQQMRQPEI